MLDDPPPFPHLPAGLHVAGLGRTGVAIALLAAARGIQPIGLWDPAPVGHDDLGTGYLPADLGRPRAAAAERRLTELHPRTRVFAHHGREPILLGSATVAVMRGGIDEMLLVRALAAEHPVLPVVVDTRTRIGPWTADGVPGCALCEAADSRGRHPRAAGPADGAPAEEGVLGALRTAVAVHDELSAGRASLCRQGVRQVWAHGDEESSWCITPAPGCPCDPDGLTALVGDQAGAVPFSSSRTSGP